MIIRFWVWAHENLDCECTLKHPSTLSRIWHISQFQTGLCLLLINIQTLSSSSLSKFTSWIRQLSRSLYFTRLVEKLHLGLTFFNRSRKRLGTNFTGLFPKRIYMKKIGVLFLELERVVCNPLAWHAQRHPPLHFVQRCSCCLRFNAGSGAK